MEPAATSDPSEVPTRHESGPPARDVAAPQPFRIDRYTVIRQLGVGGMGAVYLAYDEELDRCVALKWMHAGEHEGSFGRARMLREAQALAKLSHPNVVQVYAVGSADGRVFLAMEFFDGLTLRTWQKRQARKWREILAAYLQAGRGLAAAHAAGLVHRDFKPDNAMIDASGRVCVVDFGIARVPALGDEEPGASPRLPLALTDTARLFAADASALSGPLTEAGTLLGTPAYMAPEQMMRAPADARSDQFGFCVSLWEGLYGARPFVGRRVEELAPQVFAGELRAPRGQVPAAVAAVLRRGLTLDPDGRFPDMAALLAALTEAGQRRTRRLIAAGALAAVAIAAGFGYMAARTGPEGQVAAQCRTAAGLVPGWDEGGRAAARAAVLATAAPFAADAWAAAAHRLDAYADELQDMTERACLLRHAGGLAPEVQALHEGCLERRRAELAAVAGVLQAADFDAVRGAAQAASGLTPLARCAELATLRAEAERLPPPREPAQVEAVAGLRDRLAAAKAEFDAGRFKTARDAARGAVEAAEAVGYAPALAEALVRHGSAQAAAAEYAEARATLRRAFAVAEAAGHDEVAATAATQLSHVNGVRLREPAEALLWSDVADAKLRRIGDPPTPRLAQLMALGLTLSGADRLVEAAEVQTRALALAESRKREAPLDFVRAANALASSRMDQNRLDEAEALLRESLALRQQVLGQHHPDVAVVLHNLGRVAVQRLEHEAALGHFRRALAIRERSLGGAHPAVAETLAGLAVASCQTGREAECLGLNRRSLAVAEEAHGSEAMALLTPLCNLALELASRGEFAAAEAHLRRGEAIAQARGEQASSEASWIFYDLGIVLQMDGRPAEAIAPLQQALAIRERVFGPEHVEVGFAAHLLGEALVASKRATEAAPLLARGRAIVAMNPSAGLEIVLDHLGTATARWRRDRPAGRALARTAAEGLPLADPAEAQRRIEAWLASHPG
ncbi:serine/threonine-protein kinase [Nannocystis bainbridge]|uniref:Serine/threonine-protein kinase n=1 Tax=Nannocystis bainbridge TaxID=2995303 RepID=A0ABT5DUU1_9BACT|nr:serine/threonine-protein kinase [Nannocystis bainbridge]MDC0717417.1 serine/threonine-protein kinase [Nannocystis bainbridge]